MNKPKLSPLLVVLLVALVGTMGGMGYTIATQGASAVASGGVLFAVAGIVVIAVIASLLVRDTRRQLAEQAAQNERNQAAILQLLDEIADLAEGDLTTQARIRGELVRHGRTTARPTAPELRAS